jgi:diaminopimelate epimerase
VSQPFAKYEGLGNDFLVVEQARFPGMTPVLAQQLCDRHFGVGGDGVLVTGLREGRPFMRVFNADGSLPEMCGNGLRCVALYLLHEQLMEESAFEILTDAGPHRVQVARQGEGASVEVQMRPASLEASEVLGGERGRYVDQPFELDGETVHITAVSMGNPHAVLFDDMVGDSSLARGSSRFDSARLGPRIERDPRFKAGVNVGFARLRDQRQLDLTVWERGVGFTLACGTGACAAAVAAIETGRVPRGQPLTVHLPGGPLTIRVGDPAQPISMTGPARRVFKGALSL